MKTIEVEDDEVVVVVNRQTVRSRVLIGGRPLSVLSTLDLRLAFGELEPKIRADFAGGLSEELFELSPPRWKNTVMENASRLRAAIPFSRITTPKGTSGGHPTETPTDTSRTSALERIMKDEDNIG